MARACALILAVLAALMVNCAQPQQVQTPQQPRGIAIPIDVEPDFRICVQTTLTHWICTDLYSLREILMTMRKA
jgi:hypothetical protein